MENRRDFIKQTASLALGAAGVTGLQAQMRQSAINPSAISDINIIGPKEGYAPQVGTLVSMMNWMRGVILQPVYGMSVKDLDYRHDDQSDSTGVILMHLVATERFYQINTFEEGVHFESGRKGNQLYRAASSLGSAGWKTFNGKDLDYYLEKLESCRQFSLAEMKKYDDSWLEVTDDNFWESPTNNYCKWFHVVEHESNHNGLIKYLKRRLHSN